MDKKLAKVLKDANKKLKENKIFQISIGKVESIDLFDDNNDPRTDYIAIKFNSHPSKAVLNALKSKYGINIPKYVNWLTQTREFYKMVDIMIDFAYKNTISKGGKVLIYIATNDGVLRLYKYICETMPQYIGLVGIFTSVVAKDEKRKELNKKIIISTMKSCSAGEDIPGLKMTIVMAEPFKSEILARQSLGRCRDRDTLYVEMVDVGFYHLNKFYNKKLPVFNKYALSTSEENYDSTEIQRLSDDIRMDQSTRRGFCLSVGIVCISAYAGNTADIHMNVTIIRLNIFFTAAPPIKETISADSLRIIFP